MWDDSVKPCKEAVKASFVRVDERTVDDPKKIRFRMKGQSENWWYEDGRNHRVEKGHIKRDFDDEAWFVDMDWKDLPAFIKKYGAIVIQQHHSSPDFLEIEIYDGYRE